MNGLLERPANGSPLPTTWKYRPLGELAEITMGNSPPGDSYNEDGHGVPLINGPVEFSEGAFGLTVRSKYTTAPTKMCHEGDFLICVRGSTTGRTNIAAFNACIGRGVASIRCHVNQRYVNHFLRTLQQQIHASGRGSTFPSISQQQLSDLQVPIPFAEDATKSLHEQKRIADILDKADGIRHKRQEAHNAISKMPFAAFRETFRNYLNPDASPHLLSDAAEVVSGVAKGRKLNGAATRDVPYLRVANVQAGYLDLAEIKTIPAKESEVKDLALQHGDVVMTEGGDFDKLGRGALWEHDIPDCIHQNHVFRVRTDRKKLLPTFFVHFLQTELVKGYFRRCAKKTTNLASINMTQLRALPVPQPPLKLQERFDDELKKLQITIHRQNTAQTDADCLFHSIVHRAFRGEL